MLTLLLQFAQAVLSLSGLLLKKQEFYLLFSELSLLQILLELSI